MVRTSLIVAAMLLVGLFGVYYFRDRSGRDSMEKARGAAQSVGSVVVDEGAAGLAKARLTQALGYETAGFLHVWLEQGRALVYGLAPADVTAEAIRTAVEGVPGVQQVEVMVQTRPEYVTSILNRRRPGGAP